MTFDRIEAKNVGQVSLFYTLSTENPGSAAVPAEVTGWEVRLNGVQPAAAVLTAIPQGASVTDGRPARGARLEIPGEAARTLILKLDLDLPAPINTPRANSNNFDEYSANLQVSLSAGNSETELRAAAAFPRIQEPEFTVTSIAIMQGDLINTRFRVDLRVDNPNPFPVDLAAFGYELYGTGRFWAGGKERNVLEIPARDSAETRLFLVTNFIGMQRGLLDQVIAQGQVPYRFTGEALISTGIPLLPEFRMDFSRSGVSAVIK
ncbi:hypothetical protein FACS1894110_08300 [Spirochaetia bacterium]|nr:hypothetical protein FACS1894110_08300 [Spirochaetia bacterium]